MWFQNITLKVRITYTSAVLGQDILRIEKKTNKTLKTKSIKPKNTLPNKFSLSLLKRFKNPIETMISVNNWFSWFSLHINLQKPWVQDSVACVPSCHACKDSASCFETRLGYWSFAASRTAWLVSGTCLSWCFLVEMG